MSEQVQNWMAETVVAVCSKTILEDAAELMDSHKIRRLAVFYDDRLTGILNLGDLMTPDPISIPYTASLGLAAQTMLQLRVSGLPVVDENGELCGLLSESDLFRFIVHTAD